MTVTLLQIAWQNRI